MASAGVLSFDIIFIQEMIFNWICLSILSAVLYRLLYKPVLNTLKARERKISDTVSEAEKRLLEAKSLKREYEKKMVGAEQERNRILSEARKRGLEIEAIIIKRAKTGASELKERAALDIALERAKASEQMKSEMIDISALMAKKIISDYTKEDVKELMLKRSVEEIKCGIQTFF